MRRLLRSSVLSLVLLPSLLVACYDGEVLEQSGGAGGDGAVLAGGAGGAGGGGGAASMESAATPIMPNSDGWVDGSSNSLGLQGSLTTSTGTDSTIAFTSDGSQLCLAGTTGQVVGDDYATYWGAAATLNLCQASPSDAASTLGACPLVQGLAEQVVGVRFTVQGAAFRRFNVVFKEQGRETSASVLVQAAGEVMVLLADAAAAAAAPVDPSKLEAIEISVVPSPRGARQFDFCITDLEVLTGPAWGAPPEWMLEPGAGKRNDFVGVNLSCAEFGEGNLPGTYGADYIYPSQSNVDYYANAGMNVIRLPFRWERLQRSLGAELDPEELPRLQGVVDYAISRGMSVILDPHNYARYTTAGVAGVVGVDVELGAFADFWRRLAGLYANNDRVIFGLMNEPHTMATETWLAAANAALAAIREAGANNLVLVPGNGWTGAHSWTMNYYGTPNSQVMPQVVDPADNFAFELHQYMDSDSSGSDSTCASETIGAERVTAMTDWLRSRGYRGFLGEFGAADNNTCLTAMEGLLNYLGDNVDVWMGWTVWAGGPWWNNYFLSVEPLANGQDRKQMKVLKRHLDAP